MTEHKKCARDIPKEQLNQLLDGIREVRGYAYTDRKRDKEHAERNKK